VELVPASLMLYGSAMLFINGEPHRLHKGAATPLRQLADARRLPGRRIQPTGLVTDMLYRWYRAGYIYLSRSGPKG
jgi:hypothetical protein